VRALVTGGYFDATGEGVVWHVDLDRGSAEVVLRWTPPPHLRVPTKGFAGASLGPDGLLYVAAHAAVVRIDPARAVVTGVLHQPCMNDLHHVAVHDDRLLVSNTGLGAIDVLDREGRFLGSHALLPAWANARRLGGEDFPAERPPVEPGWSGEAPQPWPPTRPDDGYHSADRRSAPFHRNKVPDHLHVNHVVPHGDRLVATCFADGTLRDVHRFEVLARLDGAFPHDGELHGDAIWITTIDGGVLELDANAFAVRRRLDAFASGHHGWCRGLAVTEEHLAVGLTEVRPSRLPRHRWSDRRPQGSETSVLLLDREDGRLLARADLTDADRHTKIYSILPLGGA